MERREEERCIVDVVVVVVDVVVDDVVVVREMRQEWEQQKCDACLVPMTPAAAAGLP